MQMTAVKCIAKLPTLRLRRVRGDMIEVFKIVNGNYDRIDIAKTREIEIWIDKRK